MVLEEEQCKHLPISYWRQVICTQNRLNLLLRTNHTKSSKLLVRARIRLSVPF